jgi:hypothetical protein
VSGDEPEPEPKIGQKDFGSLSSSVKTEPAASNGDEVRRLRLAHFEKLGFKDHSKPDQNQVDQNSSRSSEDSASSSSVRIKQEPVSARFHSIKLFLFSVTDVTAKKATFHPR